MSKQKQQLTVVEKTDEDFMTRISQPRIWEVLKSDFLFQVLTDERMDDVLDMFKVIFILHTYVYHIYS